MGAFSVALSAWALTSVTTMVASPAEQQATASAVTSQVHGAGDDGVALATQTRVIAGFRMEGAPELDVVFGDTERYRRHIDAYLEIDQRMRQSRESFSRSVQQTLDGLVATRRGCPSKQIADSYSKARDAAQEFRRQGALFESKFVAIRTLDDLGETAGLTPDYRWKVRRVERLYRAALIDLREMRVAFLDQLGAELDARGCSRSQLLSLAAKTKLAPAPAEPAQVSPKTSARPKVAHTAKAEERAVPASTVTFFIDNRACTDTQQVYLDGTLLGQVTGNARTAFQALAGRHSLCLIGDDGADCGSVGTVRSVYIHDSWSIALHCEK